MAKDEIAYIVEPIMCPEIWRFILGNVTFNDTDRGHVRSQEM